jgi:hypothetical protein
MGSATRFLLLADSEIPIKLKLNEDGQTTLLNHREVKDATLGVNPLTRGYIDMGSHAYTLWARPSLGSSFHVAKDAGILAGTSYRAYRLAALKMGTKGRVGAAVTAGLILAPVIVHGVERLLD